MSADILEGIDDADKNSISLTMRASGFAQLTIMGPIPDPDLPDDGDGPITSFNLTPDVTGLQNAQTIIDSLREWQKHMCRINPELKMPDERR